MAVDPIEKRPFFHFLPGSKCLSIGFSGCSLRCEYCQNFEISQFPRTGKFMSNASILDCARKKNVQSIVFSYNEPTLYLQDIAEISHDKGDIKVAVKSNGFVHRSQWDMANDIDAWNIDVKGSPEEYEAVCGGESGPVWDFIKFLGRSETHLEISFLVTEASITSRDACKIIRDKICDISPHIPVHLLYCYPVYKSTSWYEKDLLLELHELFCENMNFVYTSNIYGPNYKRDTNCTLCERVMIKRSPTANVVRTCCCGLHLPGVMSTFSTSE